MAAVTGTVIAGAALANNVYQSDKNRQAGKKQTQTQSGPEYLDSASQFAINRGKDIANRPYEAYDGSRVAGLSSNEATASNLAARAPGGAADKYLNLAGEEIAGMDEWSEDTAKKYMDPYVGQVVDSSLRKENEAFAERSNLLKSQAVSRGAFGGDRATLLEAQETGRHLDAVGDITAKGYSSAYQSAAQLWQADNSRRLNASNAYRAVGGDISQLNSQQITDLMKTGQSGRLIEQMQLDTDYNDFLEERDWDVSNLQPLLTSIQSARGGTTTQTQTQSQAGANGAGQLLGIAATLAGYFGGMGQDSYTAGTSGTETTNLPDAGQINYNIPNIQ